MQHRLRATHSPKTCLVQTTVLAYERVTQTACYRTIFIFLIYDVYMFSETHKLLEKNVLFFRFTMFIFSEMHKASASMHPLGCPHAAPASRGYRACMELRMWTYASLHRVYVPDCYICSYYCY